MNIDLHPIKKLIDQIFGIWARVTSFLNHPKFSALLSLAIFAVALWIIGNELNNFVMHDLMSALHEMRIAETLIALFAVILAYFGLILNDRYCLNLLGKAIIFARTFRASIASYALSKTLGYSWAIAANAKSRLYLRWGLKQNEIAAFSFASTSVVMIASLACAGLGLIISAGELGAHSMLNWWSWEIVGIGLLLPTFALFGFCIGGYREFTWANAKIKIPPMKVAIVQIGVAMLDKIGAALALYILLPNHEMWGFPAFVSIFILAGFLGAISGAPGGLGVFEAAILAMTPVNHQVPGSAIALVIYRLIYNILPLIAAIIILGFEQAEPVAKPVARAAKTVGLVAHAIIAQILAVLVYLCGYILLAAAATPTLFGKMVYLSKMLPDIMIEISHFLSAILGMALMMSANALWKQTKEGHIRATLYLLFGIVFGILKGLPLTFAIGFGAVLIGLFLTRKDFNIPTKGEYSISAGWFSLIAGSFLSLCWLGWFAHSGMTYSPMLWVQSGIYANSARAFRALIGSGIFFAGGVFWLWYLEFKTKKSLGH